MMTLTIMPINHGDIFPIDSGVTLVTLKTCLNGLVICRFSTNTRMFSGGILEDLIFMSRGVLRRLGMFLGGVLEDLIFMTRGLRRGLGSI